MASAAGIPCTHDPLAWHRDITTRVTGARIVERRCDKLLSWLANRLARPGISAVRCARNGWRTAGACRSSPRGSDSTLATVASGERRSARRPRHWPRRATRRFRSVMGGSLTGMRSPGTGPRCRRVPLLGGTGRQGAPPARLDARHRDRTPSDRGYARALLETYPGASDEAVNAQAGRPHGTSAPSADARRIRRWCGSWLTSSRCTGGWGPPR